MMTLMPENAIIAYYYVALLVAPATLLDALLIAPAYLGWAGSGWVEEDTARHPGSAIRPPP